MATSGDTTFTATKQEIMRAAALKIGALRGTQPMNATMQKDFGFALNAMVKRWQGSGIHVWTVSEATLFPAVGQISYSAGGGATDHIAQSYVETEIAADEDSGQTVISVEDASDFAADMNIGILLDSGTIQWTTIASIASNEITLDAALTDSAAEGANVFGYVTKIVRPLRVVDARIKALEGGNEIPIEIVSRLDYRRLPQKNSEGRISQIFYDPQLQRGIFSIWQSPTAVTDLINFTWWRPIEDFDAASDNPDLPQEWIDTLVFNLADAMALDFDVPADKQQMIAAKAKEFLSEMQGWDREPEAYSFQPDMSRYRRGG